MSKKGFLVILSLTTLFVLLASPITLAKEKYSIFEVLAGKITFIDWLTNGRASEIKPPDLIIDKILWLPQPKVIQFQLENIGGETNVPMVRLSMRVLEGSLEIYNTTLDRELGIRRDLTIAPTIPIQIFQRLAGKRKIIVEINVDLNNRLTESDESNIFTKTITLCSIEQALDIRGNCVSAEPKISCFEDLKSGLCGPSDEILPLNNKVQGKIISVYGPGNILDTSNFRISLDSPRFLLTNTEYEIKVLVENKKNVPLLFKYDFRQCISESPCSDIYLVNEVANLERAILVREGKAEFYQVIFRPFERKYLTIGLIPKQPTLISIPFDRSIYFFSLDYIDNEPSDPYTLFFQPWIKPDIVYGSVPEKGYPPQLVQCSTNMFPSEITRVNVDGIWKYGYYNSKCCNNVFYPDADCCNDNDCEDNPAFDGYCVDGKCMLKEKPPNRLVGTKRILLGSEFNVEDNCQEIPLSSIDPEINEVISKVDGYYDHMASILLNKPSTFVNFEIVKAIKVPSGFNGFFGTRNGNPPEDILNHLSTRCNIRPDEYDIIILPLAVYSSEAEAGGFMIGGRGYGKILLSNLVGAGTIIHEIGHIFGCSDLYTFYGGNLQWADNIYGDLKHRLELYDMIDRNEINNIPLKAFQVCRGELGWIDSNKNRVVDVLEVQNKR